MAKNVKPGIKKKSIGGKKIDIGAGGTGAAGGTYGPTAGSGNLGKGVVNKLRQTGAINKGPSTADAVKAAKAELQGLKNFNTRLEPVKTAPNASAAIARNNARIKHLEKMMKKWS